MAKRAVVSESEEQPARTRRKKFHRENFGETVDEEALSVLGVVFRCIPWVAVHVEVMPRNGYLCTSQDV